jgi:hypothetical protein
VAGCQQHQPDPRLRDTVPSAVHEIVPQLITRILQRRLELGEHLVASERTFSIVTKSGESSFIKRPKARKSPQRPLEYVVRPRL